MRPDHQPAAVLVRGFEQVGAADFFVTAGAEPGNDQVPFSLKRKKRLPFFTRNALAQRTGPPEVVA